MRFKRVYIEITNVCNLKCSFCLPHSRENRFMTFEEFKIILEKIKPFTNYIYLHIKGEPLLHPDVDKFIKYAFDEGFQINLTTNATLLDKHLASTKYLRQINISLHATNSVDIIRTAKKITDTIICFRIWNIDKDTANKELLEKEVLSVMTVQEKKAMDYIGYETCVPFMAMEPLKKALEEAPFAVVGPKEALESCHIPQENIEQL